MTPARLNAVFLTLLLAACQNPSPLPPPAAAPAESRSGQGIDLPSDARDVLLELQQSRLDFVARYYREPGSRWPPLSAGEAQRLSSLGLRIVAVWESHSRDPSHFTYAWGWADAMAAYQQAKAIGQPSGSAIYFAVDYNATPQSLWGIEAYFQGIAAGLMAAGGGSPTYAAGVYGSGVVCDALKRAGVARYSWLANSFAWEGSSSYPDWDIMQGERLPGLSFDQDSDEAREEYGGFQVAVSAPAASPDQALFAGAASPQPPSARQSPAAAVTASR